MSQQTRKSTKILVRNARFYGHPHGTEMLISENGRIEKMGLGIHQTQNPSTQPVQILDLENKLVLPGFVECHTHLVFAGNRGFEMEMKFQGKSYMEIAEAGGGILSTVKATRKATEQELKKLNEKRIQNFIEQGVTTLEIKSGYGLDLETEIKMLKSIPQVHETKIDIIKTFLGAHAKAPEAKTHEEHLENLTTKFLPEIKKQNLAQRVDIFVEKGFFEKDSAKDYLKKAQDQGFKVTIHADQITLSGGTELGCDLNALSVDHCIQISPKEIQQLAKSNTVAVLLPAADLYMKCDYPPARKLLEAGATVALATDFNPGTSPTQDLSLVGMLARREMKMTLDEVIDAYTTGAAKALGLQDEVGSFAEGKKADFTVWDIEKEELFLTVAGPKPRLIYKMGLLIHENPANYA